MLRFTCWVANTKGGCPMSATVALPGLTNTVTAVKNAQMAESPVLLIGGAAATLLKVRTENSPCFF